MGVSFTRAFQTLGGWGLHEDDKNFLVTSPDRGRIIGSCGWLCDPDTRPNAHICEPCARWWICHHASRTDAFLHNTDPWRRLYDPDPRANAHVRKPYARRWIHHHAPRADAFLYNTNPWRRLYDSNPRTNAHLCNTQPGRRLHRHHPWSDAHLYQPTVIGRLMSGYSRITRRK